MEQDIAKVQKLLSVNVEALTLLSLLFIKEYHNVEGTQLINISSTAGYKLTSPVVVYSASKFYVSTFTENLALHLEKNQSKIRAKVLAPSVTETEFQGKSVDYDENFEKYHTSDQMADLLIELYDSNEVVGSLKRFHV